LITFFPFLKYYFSSNRDLFVRIKQITGLTPYNLSCYQQSLRHHSTANKIHNSGSKDSNERLEYLGDAVLNSVVAEYLFKKYPYRDEGFLTETRSKLVNRETLNGVGIKIGLKKILQQVVDNRQFVANKSLYGDVLEAFLGAIYMDRGYAFTKKLILQRILIHLDLEGMITTGSNHKSKLIEWSQREGNQVEFQVVHVSSNQRYKEFVVSLVVNGEEVAQGKGETKKKAEQEASKNACDKLHIAC